MRAVNIGRTFSRSLNRGIMMKSSMVSKNEAIFHLRMIIPSLLRLKRKEIWHGSTRTEFF